MLRTCGFESSALKAISLIMSTKVRLFQEHSCAILSSFKIMIIFKNTSADFVLISADLLLKIIIILKELRIVQLWSWNERTLWKTRRQEFKGWWDCPQLSTAVRSLKTCLKEEKGAFHSPLFYRGKGTLMLLHFSTSTLHGDTLGLLI